MSEIMRRFAEWCTALIELIGIAVIAGFAIYVLVYAAVALVKKTKLSEIFQNMRQRFGRGLLLGLEFLVAADIIQTVAIDLSIETVTTLARIFHEGASNLPETGATSGFGHF